MVKLFRSELFEFFVIVMAILLTFILFVHMDSEPHITFAGMLCGTLATVALYEFAKSKLPEPDPYAEVINRWRKFAEWFRKRGASSDADYFFEMASRYEEIAVREWKKSAERAKNSGNAREADYCLAQAAKFEEKAARIKTVH